MVHSMIATRPKPFSLNVDDFFKSLSGLTLGEQYQAQNEYIAYLLVRIIVDRTEMRIQSARCTSRSQDKAQQLSADEEEELEELARLYGIVAKLFDELKLQVYRRWLIVSKRGFIERMDAIEDLRAEYDDVLEAKQEGLKLVLERKVESI